MITPRNTIRTFALICVAITSIFAMSMVGVYTYLLQSDWCAQAMGAAQLANRPESAIGGCFALLQDQVSALAINSYIFGGVIALCLAVLVVIVIAGGRLSFKAGRDGVEGNIGRGQE